jgi:plastocyanin
MSGLPAVRRSAVALIAAVAALVLLLVGVWGPPSSAQSRQTLRLRADSEGALKFNKTRLRARPGRITIVMTNPSTSGKPHAVGIEGRRLDRHGNVAQPGGVSRVRATVRRGTYEFYCPVGNHEAGGMKGTLVVR